MRSFSFALLTTAFLSAFGCSSSSSPNTAPNDGGAADDAGTDGSVAVTNDGFAWAKSFQVDSGSRIMAMAADATGVVIAGQLSGTATFGNITLTGSNSAGDAFIAKLDGTGNVLWAMSTVGSSGDFETLAIDSSGNIIVAGTDEGDAPTFSLGSTTLTPETGTLNSANLTKGGGAIFKLDSGGNVTWGKLVATTGEVNIASVAISGTTIFAAGPIIRDAAFATGGAMPITNCATAGCVFLAAYDGSGNVQWAKQAPSSPHRGTGVDQREEWLAASSTNVDLAIGGSASQAGGSSPDVMELVVSQYDLMGALTWTKVTPSQDAPAVNGLVVDATGSLYVTGTSAGLSFGSIIPLQYARPFFAKYTSAGDLSWAIGTTDVDVRTPSNTALALGDHLYTFGNGGITDPTVATGMAADVFDPATGALVSEVPCAATQGLGQETAASTLGVFVGGYGGTPSQFGTQTLSALGLFVAKLK